MCHFSRISIFRFIWKSKDLQYLLLGFYIMCRFFFITTVEFRNPKTYLLLAFLYYLPFLRNVSFLVSFGNPMTYFLLVFLYYVPFLPNLRFFVPEWIHVCNDHKNVNLP